jgi:hypothetical protein
VPHGPVVLNNIKVDNSTIGAINTGNVHSIDVSLTHLHNAGNDRARDALKEVTEAVLKDPTLQETLKQELLEQIAFLGEQSTVAAKDRKPGLIKASLDSIGRTAATATALTTIWQTVDPILRSVFGY